MTPRFSRPRSPSSEGLGTGRAQLADWVFSTEHIAISYSLRYEGKELAKLSPGTRGVVLMILFLHLDSTDERPLVIDQPEENLDPESIFDKLVPYFRAARERRQIFLVTHNANLVVNADADQVIVASSESGEGLPQMSYRSGGLEAPDIRDTVCQILEGGRRAFEMRRRRYRS